MSANRLIELEPLDESSKQQGCFLVASDADHPKKMTEVLRCIQTHSRPLQLILLACFTAMAVIGWEMVKKDTPEGIR